MREEVDEPDLGAQALDLADGGAYGGLVGATPGEEPPELRLGLEEPSTRRARRSEHRVHEGARRRLLLWRERQALFQLEHVHGAGVAVLVGGEGQAETAPLADDLLELRQAYLRRLMPGGTRAAPAVLRPRRAREGHECRHYRRCRHARWSHGPPPSLHFRPRRGARGTSSAPHLRARAAP